MTGMTAVSLFAGVGGFDLALERPGVKVTAAVEIDDAARGVLADRFPDTTLFTDVTEVTADAIRATGFVPERGILTAGWPCQGNSVAGARGGMADPRSGLWRHVVRLLADLRPRWFFGENVPGLLSVTDGEDFGVVLQDLADLSGWGSPTGLWTLSSSECPSDVVESSLSDVLETPGPHLSKYCLSPKAAAGILRRASRRGRELPPPLQQALQELASQHQDDDTHTHTRSRRSSDPGSAT